ncbi:MAG: RimK/LysX family protein [Verrucomicrobia bacterium]|nr:RimK/LysX family protein [Verrucomicrobiota bacterium]
MKVSNLPWLMVLLYLAGCSTYSTQGPERNAPSASQYGQKTSEEAESLSADEEEDSSSEADEEVEEIVEGKPGKHQVYVPDVGERYVFGWVEWICLQPQGINIKAKVDSGARTSSINAQNLVEFRRDRTTWVRFDIIHPDTKEKVTLERPVVRFVRIVQHLREPQRRPVIELEVKLGPLQHVAEFSLIDRSNFVYQVLIGRNYLRGYGLIDVEETFLWLVPARVS